MTSNELIRQIEKLGWIRKKTKSGHRKYVHPDYDYPLVIPFHSNQELKPGTLSQIQKAAGLKD